MVLVFKHDIVIAFWEEIKSKLISIFISQYEWLLHALETVHKQFVIWFICVLESVACSCEHNYALSNHLLNGKKIMNSWPHSKLVLPFWLLYQSSWWQYKLTFLRSPLFDLFMKMRYHPKCKQFSVSIWFWIFEEISVKPEHCAGKDSSNSDLSLLLLIIFYCF